VRTNETLLGLGFDTLGCHPIENKLVKNILYELATSIGVEIIPTSQQVF
jgi:hypothetical protein